MRQHRCVGIRRGLASLAVALVSISPLIGQVRAQGYGGPLTVEGLHRQSNPSAAARAFGGVTFGRESDVGLMFVNPTALQGPGGIRISVGGFRQYQDLRQEQHFAPVRYYPNLSLLLEGLTDRIPDPDPDLVGFTPADSVQRPFDDIGPNWSRSGTTNLPLHALLAVPLSIGDVALTAGLGAVQYANLDHYYQNNNVLDPSVLAQRPLPTLRPTDDNPVTAHWYQSVRSREGSMQGYGVALSGRIDRLGLTLGLSGLFVRGDSDDFERQVSRGRLTFLANEFRADSSYGRLTKTGTSTFSGRAFTLGGRLDGRFTSIGFVLRPPATFTRTYRTEVEADTTGVPVTSSVSGEDRMQLPWRGSVGLLLKPRDNLDVGLEYEFRPYGAATFTTAADDETSPWHSASLFRVGAAYEPAPWLVLRGGIRGEADVFVPEGSAIEDDPVSYRVFSAGFGVRFGGVRWNLSYEHARMRYEDIWGSAVSKNLDARHAIVTDVSFTIPTGR